MVRIAYPSRSPIARRPFGSLVATVGRGMLALVRAWESRRAMRDLVTFDHRMLADVGLNRADVRDALSEPLWRDATVLLTARRDERKLGRWNPPGDFPRQIAEAPSLVPVGAARAGQFSAKPSGAEKIRCVCPTG